MTFNSQSDETTTTIQGSRSAASVATLALKNFCQNPLRHWLHHMWKLGGGIYSFMPCPLLDCDKTQCSLKKCLLAIHWHLIELINVLLGKKEINQSMEKKEASSSRIYSRAGWTYPDGISSEPISKNNSGIYY